MSDWVRIVRRAIIRTVNREGDPGVLGKGDGHTILYTDENGTTYRNRCWVRIGDPSSTTTVVARNTKVPMQYGLPVIVAERNGRNEVIRADYERADEYTGDSLVEIPSHGHTHQRFGSDPLYVEGMMVMPLMARPQNPAAMTVYVSPGFYRYDGAEEAWTGGNSPDLSGYVPSAAAVGIAHHFIILCLNRSNNELVVVDGEDTYAANYRIPFTADDVAEISIADAYYPLAAIRLYQGQTAIQTRDIFLDLRLWGGEAGGSYVGTHASTHESDGADEIEELTLALTLHWLGW